MITIDQLLESVDLDFEPRWVTKDPSGAIAIWAEKPERTAKYRVWIGQTDFVVIHLIKLADFENKDWQECIYEVLRKTSGKIERFTIDDFATVFDTENYHRNVLDSRAFNKLNALVDAVNELMGDKHPTSKP